MISRVLILTVWAIPLFFASVHAADDYIDLTKKGNEAFLLNNFDEALEHYRNAETELPESPELDYNIASSLYMQGKYEEAVDLFTKALNSTNINQEASSHYNLGNTYFRMEDFQEAIKSYENALEINPDDLDAKYNLELSRKRLKEQIKPEQQQQQDQQEQDQQEQQEQQQDQEQDEQDQDQQQQQQESQDDDDQQKEKQEQQQERVKEMTKEDAERILNALKDEQDVQKKIRRMQAKGNYSGKDW